MSIVRTRSGRVVKKPVVLEIHEEVEDDYSEGEYDTEEETDEDEDESESESESDDDDDDADENGNLKGFVVDDEE